MTLNLQRTGQPRLIKRRSGAEIGNLGAPDIKRFAARPSWPPVKH